MSNEATKLIKRLTDLGVPVRDTKAGWMVLAPDGTSITIHRTESDHRAIKNTLSRLKKAGVQLDKETDVDIKARKETIEAVKQKLEELGNPELFAGSQVYKALGIAPATGTRALEQSGYVKVGHGMWSRMEQSKPTRSLSDMVLDLERVQSIPTVTVDLEKPAEPVNEEREFIDSVDSWAINIDHLHDLTMDQLRRTLTEFGYKFEVRVWK